MQMMNKNGFSRCAEFYIGRLRKEGRHSTAHVYKNAIFSFSKFCGTSNVSFRQVTRERLRRYGQYLYECGLKPNTISTYMRMLRCIYNRGVEAGSAPYVPRLFHDVYTGVDVRQKKALPIGELRRLLYEDPKSEILDTAKEMINRLRSNQDSHPDSPDYLFDILSSDKKRTDERAYREYQSALRRFNNRLKDLARALRLKSPVTSYTLRHSWATTAKYRGVSIEMISESLGHKSIKTTQIYLKGFGLKERTEVNKGNLSYVRNCCVDRW